MSADNSRLLNLKLARLAEQKILAEQMRDTCKDLSESNRKVRKNLEVGISISKRPGYFHYYEPETRIKEAESNHTLEKILGAIKKIEGEIETIDNELSAQASSRTPSPAYVATLNEWFAVFGHPGTEHCDKLTSFVASPKIYGGTNHHRAFKSQSLVMKKGTVTA
jgi:hypothetical protein